MDDMDPGEALRSLPKQTVDPSEALRSLIDTKVPTKDEQKISGAQEYYSQRAETNWGPASQDYREARVPGVGIYNSLSDAYRLSEAQDRYKKGTHTDDDLYAIAQHRAKEQYEEDRAKSFGNRAFDFATHVPGMLGEFAVSGGATEGVGKAVATRLGGSLGAKALGYGAQTAAMTALTPSMYVDQASRANVDKGRDPLDPRGLAPAYGLAAAQMAVLGAVQEVAPKGLEKLTGISFKGDGALQAMGRVGTQAATGPFAQAAADLATSFVGLDTGYGTLGKLRRGEIKGAFEEAAMNALQFATFGAAHEISHGGKGPGEAKDNPVVKAFVDAANDLHSQGVAKDAAGKILQGPVDIIDAIHKRDPNASRQDIEAAMQGLPEGPLRDLGMQMAAQIPVHQEAQGPAPGIDTPPEAQEPPKTAAPSHPGPVEGQISPEAAPGAAAKPGEAPPVDSTATLGRSSPNQEEPSDVNKSVEDIYAVFDKAGLTDRERHVLIEKAGGRTHEDIGKDVEALGRPLGGKEYTRGRVQQIEKDALEKVKAATGKDFESIYQSVNKPDVASAKQDLNDLTKATKDAKVVIEAEEGKGGWVNKEPEVKFQDAWLQHFENLKASEEYKQANPVGQKAMESQLSQAYQTANAMREEWLGRLKELKKTPEWKEGRTDDRGRLLDTLARQFDAETAKRRAGVEASVRPEGAGTVQPYPAQRIEAQGTQNEGSQGLGANSGSGNTEATGDKLISKFIAPEEHADVITQASRSGRTPAQAEELIRQVEGEVAQQLAEEVRAARSSPAEQPGVQAGQGPGAAGQPPDGAGKPPGAPGNGNVREIYPGIFWHSPAGRGSGAGGVTASLVTPIGKPMPTGPVMGETTKNIIRNRNAEMHQKMEISAETINRGAKFFDVWTEAAPDEATRNARFLEFTDAMQEVGGASISQLPDAMREFAQVARDVTDQHEAELKKKGYLQTFIDHYMGQIWKDPNNPNATAEEKAAQINSKRSLAGGESYRKQRSIASYREGIEAGLEPVSWNPMDLIKMKADEVDKSIAGRDMFNEAKTQGLLKFQRLGAKTQAGWRMLNDKLARVLAPPETKVTEYFDKQQMEGLEKFADSLGIKQERLTKGLGRAAGQAEIDAPQINDAIRKMYPGKSDAELTHMLSTMNAQMGGGGPMGGNATVRTKFGTPEEILAHEIGHILDRRYGMSAWLKDPIVGKELSDLADLRSSGRTSGEYKDYLRSDPERMANLVAAYLHAPELLNKVAPNAMAHLESLMAAHKELQPMRDIKPSLELGQREQMQRVAGPMLTGNYYGPNEVIDAIEKHLSPGLGGNKAFQAFRGFGNAMNMMQLGWSAYHYTATALNAQMSAAALGFEMLSRGDVAEAAKQLPKALIPLYAPIEALRKGMEMRKDYFAPGSGSPETQQLNEAWAQGGGRARMDQMYRGSQLEAFQKAYDQFKAGQSSKALGVIGRMLPALNEFVSLPLMEHFVPLVKNGVGADMVKYEMSKLPPGADINQKRAVYGKVVDSIDNRFGQMIYDNLFWNRTLKDSLMTAFRSVGWNLGTGRELGGGLKDIPSSIKGLQSGEGISHRLAYIGGMTAVTAMYGAMMQYMYTGKGPDEAKDFFFPKTGQKNPDGTAERKSLPVYLKDVYGLFNRADEGPMRIGRNLWGMAKSKLHPAVIAATEMMNNEDFHGTAIDNPNDPILRQTKDDMAHFLKAFEPFSIRGFREQGTGGGIGQFFGITKAPQYITKTSEEQRSAETSRKVTMTPLAKKARAAK